MNKKFYECSVKYRTTNENGSQKISTTPFIVDSVSFTDAEARINEEMKNYISEEFEVTNIKKTNIYEVHLFEDCEFWFKSKVSLISYNEESGKENKVNIYILVQANDAKEAYVNTAKIMKNSISEYTIPSITETKIEAFFDYIS